MRFIHMRTAYILRWNRPDYKEIIGVFGMEEHMDNFIKEHFTPEEMEEGNILIEHGRYYEPELRGRNIS
jgi:hypothetical protein